MNVKRAAVLALITLVCYGPALQADFVAGDRQFILKNELAADAGTALRSFVADYWSTLGGESFVYYRPLTVLTHCIDTNLWGLNPVGHHAVNSVLHMLVTLLVFAFFLKLLPGRSGVCFAGALLFALHPIHTHSVVYVMGRTDVLSTLFGLLCLIILCRTRCTAWQHAAAALCYLAALLCKEIAVTIPGLYALYCCALPARRPKRAHMLRAAVLLGAALGIYLVLRIGAIGLAGTPEDTVSFSLWQRGLLVFMTLGFYCTKLLLPLNLSYYSNLVVPHVGMGLIDSVLIAAGIICAALMLIYARKGIVGMALAWIGITLLPVLNIITLPVLAKENYLYLPSVGFCLLAALGFGYLHRRLSPMIAVSVCAAIALLYSMQVYMRMLDYRDPALYLLSAVRAMRPLPPDALDNPHYFEGAKNWFTTSRNLGYLYKERGAPDISEYWFVQALGYTAAYFDPRYAAGCHQALAELYVEQGRIDEALAQLAAALPGAARPQQVYNLMGVCAAMRKDRKAAENFFVKALEIEPGFAPARANLARLRRQDTIKSP
jgi:tetratricopeptide (TPR) repeat protein